MIMILTGPPAAGKSTLAPLIAQQRPRGAVIDVDKVRAMVVQPHIAPWLGEAGMAQLRLGAQNACQLAHTFTAEGYDVVIADVLTDETATLYQKALAPLEHQIILLLPSLAAVLERNRERGQWLTDEEVRLLYGWQTVLHIYDQKIDNTNEAVTTLAATLAQRFTQH
ncbi:MAG: AAA family ATPase [Caldilineaceae bacterium]|nr:AAA family ATPase [Caldilineaceae bacterium]